MEDLNDYQVAEMRRRVFGRARADERRWIEAALMKELLDLCTEREAMDWAAQEDHPPGVSAEYAKRFWLTVWRKARQEISS